ncbi:hypothetical protein DAI22_12g167201 [Oryza sativa Japonica Group]|nr:hypothetical protein DAI22_12g167201 [Oryza sativa Japonica Group]
MEVIRNESITSSGCMLKQIHIEGRLQPDCRLQNKSHSAVQNSSCYAAAAAGRRSVQQCAAAWSLSSFAFRRAAVLLFGELAIETIDRPP